MISDCRLCGDLPKLSCDTMKKGKSRILVLGESPAKDGWIVSGKAFYNKDGKLQATEKFCKNFLICAVLTLMISISLNVASVLSPTEVGCARVCLIVSLFFFHK